MQKKQGTEKMTLWYCNNCRLVNGDHCGPWDDEYDCFSNIKLAHKNCLGFQAGEPKLKGRKNWGHTEIEKAFTDCLISNWEKWLDAVTADARDARLARIGFQRSRT